MNPTAKQSEEQRRVEEREKWISRFTVHFGDPIGLEEYRDGTETFRGMRDASLKYANGLLAEAEYYHLDMFNDED